MKAVVIERVEFAVFAGREDEFEEAMRGGIALLKGAAGCASVTLARGVEEPARYLLMLQWRSIEDHMAFTTTGEFARFRQMASPFFAEAPSRLHFAPVIEKHR
jgi:heme-degrading monooxygenase HmoA